MLKKGDVILEVNGVSVESPEDLLNEVGRSKDTLQFRIAPGFYNKNTLKTQQVSVVRYHDFHTRRIASSQSRVFNKKRYHDI